MCQKWFAKFLVLLTFWPHNPLLRGCLLHGGVSTVPLASAHWEPIVGGSRHTQHIPISAVTGESLQKKLNRLFGQRSVFKLLVRVVCGLKFLHGSLARAGLGRGCKQRGRTGLAGVVVKRHRPCAVQRGARGLLPPATCARSRPAITDSLDAGQILSVQGRFFRTFTREFH